MQYIKIIQLIGFKENIITKIIFGSVFDPLDILAYSIGIIFLLIINNYKKIKFKL